jgi:dCMP deaminase
MVMAKKAAARHPPVFKRDLCSCSITTPCNHNNEPETDLTRKTRLSRAEMFVGILEVVKKRSTCTRAQVSALIVRENRIISMGYGGSPSGLPHCIDVGCKIGENGGCIRTIHAESNAIAFSSRHGISVEGAELWCSLSPCLDCAKLLINSGISSVYFLEKYRKTDGIELLIEAGIKVYLYTPNRIISCSK